jgi:conjugative transposon TraN protein
MRNLFLLLPLLILSRSTSAQIAYSQNMDQSTFRSSYSIRVSANKTTHLIFPYEIKYADLGSKDLVGEAVASAGNVFRIKGTCNNFTESSLAVITADGRLFSFRVGYEENPLVLTYDMTPESMTADVPKTAKISTGSAARLANNLNTLGNKAMGSKRRIKHVGTQDQGMGLHLKNILYQDDVMFLVLGLDNDSKLDYDLDFVHVFISQAKKAGESSASQDVPVDPIKIFNTNQNTVPHRKEITKVVAIGRMTLENDRRLMVQVNEKQGGRMLTLPIGTEELASARPL